MSGEANVLKINDVNGRPTKIIYETMSGVVFHITPINLPTLRAIQLKAELLYPMPDPKPYQTLEENGFAEGQLTPASDNPQYIIDCKKVEADRGRWVDRAVFDYAAQMPAYPSAQSLVTAFSHDLMRLRKVAELPDDDYEAVLFHIVLSGNTMTINSSGEWGASQSDYVRIIQLAIQTLALTPDEVVNGIRFFRPNLPERRPAQMVK